VDVSYSETAANSNWSEIAIPAQQINLATKPALGYPDGYYLR
jgi:hypothetical protein